MVGAAVIRVINRCIQVAFTRYGDKSRRQRRLMLKALGPAAIPTYHPLLEIETHALLKRLLDEPKSYESHLKRCVYAVEIDSAAVLLTHGYWLAGTRVL